MNLSFHNLRRTFSILCTRRFCMKRNLSLTTVNCLGRQLVAGVCCNSNSQRVPKSSIPHLRRIAVHIKYDLRIGMIVRSHVLLGLGRTRLHQNDPDNVSFLHLLSCLSMVQNDQRLDSRHRTMPRQNQTSKIDLLREWHIS